MKKIFYKTDQNHPQIRAYKEAVEKGQNSQHVLPRGSEWVVKKGGAQKASHIFGSQSEAIDAARAIAQNQGTVLFIHGRDGRIRDRKDF